MEPVNTPPTHEHLTDVEHAKQQFKGFWERFGNIALTVLLLITAPLAIYRLVGYFRAQAVENAWSDLATTSSPEAYRIVAQSHGQPVVQAMAYLRGGDAIMTRLLQAEDPATTQASRQSLLDDAKSMYEQAAGTPGAPEAVRLGAELGLAGVHEAMGDYDAAQKLYTATAAHASAHPTLAATAQARLKLLPRLSSPVLLAAPTEPPAPPAPPAPSTQEPSGEPAGEPQPETP